MNPDSAKTFEAIKYNLKLEGALECCKGDLELVKKALSKYGDAESVFKLKDPTELFNDYLDMFQVDKVLTKQAPILEGWLYDRSVLAFYQRQAVLAQQKIQEYFDKRKTGEEQEVQEVETRRCDLFWLTQIPHLEGSSSDKNKDHYELIMRCLYQFYLNDWKRSKADLEHVYVLNKNTLEYEKHLTLEEAVLSVCSREECSSLVRPAACKTHRNNCISYLQLHPRLPDFPWVERRRRCYSCPEGVFDFDTRQFVPKDKASSLSFLKNQGVYKHFPNTTFRGAWETALEVLKGKKPICDCLPTPALDEVFDKQHLSAKARWIFYVLTGRSLYPLGERDTWQVTFWLLGCAGTGKSTIIKLLQNMFPTESVLTYGSGAETTFGLEGLDQAHCLFIPELKPHEFFKSFPVGRLLTLISGNDSFSVPRKYRTPLQFQGNTAPVLIAGNDPPTCVDDTHGALARRLIYLPFRHKVHNRDPTLAQRIEKEMGAIIIKSLLCYEEALVEWEGKDLSAPGVLPDDVLKEQRRVMAATHPLFHFLTCTSQCELGAGKTSSLGEFQSTFNQFCRRYRNEKPPVWNEDLYVAPFSELGISIIPKSQHQDEYLIGVELIAVFQP
jgi:phage/plasmid-associated DNA primase